MVLTVIFLGCGGAGGGVASGPTLQAPSNLTYSANPITYIQGVPIAPNLPSNAGGAVASYAVNPALPFGLSLDVGTGAISGTPTAVTPATSYVVTASNATGLTTATLVMAVSAPAPAPSFTLQFGVSSTATTSAAGFGRASVSPVTIDPSAIQFQFGMAGSQSGSLVCGYTGSLVTVSFDVTTDVNGVTVGANGVSEMFDKTDPSIINSTLTGPASFPAGNGTPGIFMTRFDPNGTMLINVTNDLKNLSKTLPLGNEMALRFANPTEPLVDASGNTATIVMGPHFFYDNALYSDATNNLTLSTIAKAAQDFQYILFVPATKIGLGSSFTVLGPNTVIDPVTSDLVDATAGWAMTDPSTWVAKDTVAWISDGGCVGLASVIDAVAGTDRSNQAWKDLAAYFQAYFIKFYKARSTMFNNPKGILGATEHPATFEIIALDDITNGPIDFDKKSTLTILHHPADSTYTLTNGTLDLSGNPPLKFSTMVVKQ
jgi:hypothetical protein